MTVVLTVFLLLLLCPVIMLTLGYFLFGGRIPAFRQNNGFAFGYGQSPSAGGNVAFDDYRKQELDKVEAARRRLDEERRDFDAFEQGLRRAKDQAEFDRFTAERRAT